MTEEIAKENWCPFTSNGLAKAVLLAARKLSNDEYVNINADRCIGSECMAWRFDDPDDPDCVHGYCGLVK